MAVQSSFEKRLIATTEKNQKRIKNVRKNLRKNVTYKVYDRKNRRMKRKKRNNCPAQPKGTENDVIKENLFIFSFGMCSWFFIFLAQYGALYTL